MDINKQTTIKEYEEYLKRVLANVEASLGKIDIGLEMPIYKILENNKLDNHLNIFNIDVTNLISVGAYDYARVQSWNHKNV